MQESAARQPAVEVSETEATAADRAGSGPAWEVRQVPPGPDHHDPTACRSGTLPGPVEVVAARARGRKHKHLGQHCDDWYELGVVGDWTLVAVADGAGSRPLSRVGARAACTAAVEFLARRLAIPALRARVLGMTGRLFQIPRSDRGPLERDRLLATDALAGAMRAARAAVVRAAGSRQDDPELHQILGRAPVLDDLATTLSLAIHKPIRLGGEALALVASCQVGDGVVAAFNPGGGRPAVTVLGVPDAGEYSGQTEFLTSLADFDADSLAGRVRTFVGTIRMLIVATDGVGDDFFPPDPGLLRLGAELEALGVVPATGLGPVEAATPTPRGGGRVPPERLLLDWLDTYYVRGSFDDRTLVVLHGGGGHGD